MTFVPGNGTLTLVSAITGTGAPLDAGYLTALSNGSLLDERVIDFGPGLDGVDNGPNTTFTVILTSDLLNASFVTWDSNDTILTDKKVVLGTTNQITKTINSGDVTFSIATNPVIPGTSGMTLPIGTAAQEVGVTDGMVRYDSDLDKFRGLENGNWINLVTEKTFSIAAIIDGASTPIVAGDMGEFRMDFDCTIIGWTVLADQTGSAQFDIKKSSYASFPSMSSITAAAKPTISSAQKNQSNTLTGWTTAVSKGDILKFILESVGTVTRVNLTLECRKT
jgi:hypothetical protein